MNNLVFGKYIPVDSLMHRIDPRAKLIGLFMMIAVVGKKFKKELQYSQLSAMIVSPCPTR